jgi:hypothetical protein
MIDTRLDRSTMLFANPFLPFCLAKTEESARYRQPFSESEWQETCRQISRQIHELDQQKVQWLAEQIYLGILWLDPSMTEYCQLTCTLCEDPCCTGKEIFFNQADLLYLMALNSMRPPIGQTRSKASAPCRYLSVRGCNLPRPQRPYICVWFLCEPQIELLNASTASYQRQVIKTFQHIRTCRLQLEALYEERFQQR